MHYADLSAVSGQCVPGRVSGECRSGACKRAAGRGGGVVLSLAGEARLRWRGRAGRASET